jgi:hypothetical protein
MIAPASQLDIDMPDVRCDNFKDKEHEHERVEYEEARGFF